MRFELFFFDTVDSSLGRVDHGSFSHQTLMEMVIEGITNTDEICGEGDEPIDIHEWRAVMIEDGKVVEINWGHIPHSIFTGSLCLEWLPSSVRKFVVNSHKLTGTLNWTSLPTAMERLDLALNAFTGSICLERLPERMEYLNVSLNKLSDPMDGHLYVVGRTSTPSWGKPGATRCCWDPPWQYRVATGASTVYHCRGPLASVATKVYLWPPRSARMRAVRKFHSLSLLLRAGDVHPNPGPIL
ncbi:hypothetical protein XU18_2080, partial [Perkinsela sp. CCAP 1560/4]